MVALVSGIFFVQFLSSSTLLVCDRFIFSLPGLQMAFCGSLVVCTSVIYDLFLLVNFSSIVRAETTIVSAMYPVKANRDSTSDTQLYDFMLFIDVLGI